MHDVAEFLHRHPPFEGLEEEDLERLAQTVEVEYFGAGTRLFGQGEEPLRHVWVVRRGKIELIDRGRVVDELGEGEMVGHRSMLSGEPTGFEAGAGEDTLAYRVPGDAMVPLLTRPAGLRFVARSLLARPKPDPAALPANLDPAQQPAAQLIRGEPIVTGPETSLRALAEEMSPPGIGAALIRLGDGQFGIVTDSDIRTAVARGMPYDVPVQEVMTAPAFAVGPDRFGAEVLLEMLKRGIRHVPVIAPFGEPLGVLEEVDLLAARTETPFELRRAVAEAADAEELRQAAARRDPMVVALHDAGVAPAQITAINAIVVDALTTRLLRLTIASLGPPPRPLAWLALGSQGRREPVPSSDIDSALAWDGGGEEEAREYMGRLGGDVSAELSRAGLSADTHGVSAAHPLFERSVGAWRRAIRHAIEHPGDEDTLILISLLFDARTVDAFGDVADVLEEFRAVRHRRGLLRLMLRSALAHRPPQGFLRGIIVEHGGEHRGRLDVKHGGILPVTSIARYASLAAGATVTSTTERLRVAGTAGVLDGGAARSLQEAFELFMNLRLEHQVEQIRRGAEPDDFIDPEALNSLSRRYLRDAFGEVRAVQRRLGNELTFG